jgi:hypothetical protein
LFSQLAIAGTFCFINPHAQAFTLYFFSAVAIAGIATTTALDGILLISKVIIKLALQHFINALLEHFLKEFLELLLGLKLFEKVLWST